MQVHGVELSKRPSETGSMARGDSDSVREMYERHAGDLYAYLARRVGPQVAEDVLADVFREAIESSSAFDPARGSQRGWLFGIATNLVRRHWQVEQRRLLSLQRVGNRSIAGGDPLLDLQENVAARVDAVRDASRLLVAVCELDAEDRDLLILSGWEHMTSREIGQVLGITAGAVRTRLHRVRELLRRATSPGPSPEPSNSGVIS